MTHLQSPERAALPHRGFQSTTHRYDHNPLSTRRLKPSVVIAPPFQGSVSTSVSEVCRLQECGAKLDKYFHFNHWF